MIELILTEFVVSFCQMLYHISQPLYSVLGCGVQ